MGVATTRLLSSARAPELVLDSDPEKERLEASKSTPLALNAGQRCHVKNTTNSVLLRAISVLPRYCHWEAA
jgi:hypothetical protein